MLQPSRSGLRFLVIAVITALVLAVVYALTGRCGAAEGVGALLPY